MITGCCFNVFTFEKLLEIDNKTTNLITFAQNIFIFLAISLYLAYTHYWDNRKARLSITSWNVAVPILLQTLGANVNNFVFQYNLSMPTHIIIRSSGTVTTLLLGWVFFNKKYTMRQIIGSTLIAVGTVLFTLNAGQQLESSSRSSIMGVCLLLGTTIMNSGLSLYKESIYTRDGSKMDWKGALYYNTVYGLLFYIPLVGTIKQELLSLWRSNQSFGELLGWNLVTQMSCILGVNLLVFKVSALSFTIILLIRRFLSLFLSMYIFETPVGQWGIFGIGLVILGSLTYSLNNNRPVSVVKKDQ